MNRRVAKPRIRETPRLSCAPFVTPGRRPAAPAARLLLPPLTAVAARPSPTEHEMTASAFKVDFIGIGSGKCGSTWLHENLAKHPQICDSNLKELNYFSDLYDEHPPSWYAAQYASCDCGQLKGEFSVTYLSHPKAAERIKQQFPEARLLAIVRDPVQRTFSNYLHSQRKGDIPPDLPFDQYIQDEANLSPARYAEHFETWYRTFPASQIHVIVLEDFLRDQLAGYRAIYRFIGVDNPDFVPPGYDQRSNEARNYRFLFIENILVRTYRWLSRKGYTRLVKSILDSGAGSIVRKLNDSKQPPPKIDEPSRERLKQYFRPHNARLAALLGRDLSCWEERRELRAE